ncbi:MAG: DUF2520 domain-containing protein [Bacteroidaceae bacterium]|nr:DUF2520 domain-containing protein [Bacteroidaceae bacterium]
MKIVLIGAGNLATNLGKALSRAGHDIAQVYSRTEESAKTLALALKCPYTIQPTEVLKSADVYVISVKDTAIQSVAYALCEGREGQLFVHTAGSISVDILPTVRRGVFYPMQTFSKQKEVDFSIVPCFVEAQNDSDLQLLKDLAGTISDTVYEMNSENRQYLHLAAVFCCNFANHCYTLGAQLLKEHGDIPFSVMRPLIDETASKLYTLSPKEAQTGPAVRWDTNVIDKQLQLLDGKPEWQMIYKMLSESIHANS